MEEFVHEIFEHGDKIICSYSSNRNRMGKEFIVSNFYTEKEGYICVDELIFYESYRDVFHKVLLKMDKPSEDSILISNWASNGAKKKNCGRMCSDCAFKLGSDANLEEINVDAAKFSVESTVLGTEIKFNCHPGNGYGDSGKLCNGYKNALEFFQIYKY